MPRRFSYIGSAAISSGTAQQPYNFGIGSHTFTVPKSGYWKFVAWGEGGGAASTDTNGSASGAYAEKTKHLTAGQSVTIQVNSSNTNHSVDGYNGGTTTITFPDATTVKCTGGTHGANPTGGTATGGDVNLSGSANGVAGGGTNGGSATSGNTNGGGAPANLPYRGGDGGTASSPQGGTPGGGANQDSVGASGGAGAALAVFLHD